MRCRRIGFGSAGCFVLLLALGLTCFSLRLARAKETAVAVEFDLQRFIDAELKAGKHRIVVPAGHYRVRPHDRQHLVLRDLKDITIVADGVEMICTETTRALTINHCTNLTVRGLVIDYDPLPFTQGRITAFGPDKKFRKLSCSRVIRRRKRRAISNTKSSGPIPARCVARTAIVQTLEAVDSRHLRIFTPGESADSPEQVGDLDRHWVRIRAAREHGTCGGVQTTTSMCDWKESTFLPSNCFGFMESGLRWERVLSLPD